MELANAAVDRIFMPGDLVVNEGAHCVGVLGRAVSEPLPSFVDLCSTFACQAGFDALSFLLLYFSTETGYKLLRHEAARFALRVQAEIFDGAVFSINVPLT